MVGLGSGSTGKLGCAWRGAWSGDVGDMVGGGMQWYTTWIGKVGLGHWGMSGLSGDSEEGLGVVSDFLGYTECRFSR